MHTMNTPLPDRQRRVAGFSLVELLVAMTIGLALLIALSTVFLASQQSSRRQSQISNLQQNVRIAFDYLARDARMVGHLGCYTGRGDPLSNFPATTLDTNYVLGIEGYEYTNTTADAYTLTSYAPANTTTGTDWQSNTLPTNGIANLPLSTLAGTGTGDGLTPGSDVLVIRTIADGPFRLTVPSVAAGNTLTIENVARGTCSDGTTPKVSGLCAGSHALIASCTNARVFSVNAIAAGNVTMNGSLGGDPVYPDGASEVFPLQTIAYYVKLSSSGTTTSLYRRIFDGNTAGGIEQELIEGVENLQVRYGVDTAATTPDGVIDEYRTAQGVNDWSRVVAVRMGLLMRAQDPVEGDTAVAASAPVNGVDVTFPSVAGARRYDRRVFTTTVAIRNRISYF